MAWEKERRGKWEFNANACMFSSRGNENVPKLDYGDGCTTLWIY